MKKKLYMLLLIVFGLSGTKLYSVSDCEYFVYPQLGINHYTACLSNPSAYEDYFIYHTVNFYDETTLLSSQSIRDGSSAVAPADPYHYNQNFIGWDTDFSNVTSNLTIRALWEIGYSITYLDYNGTVLKTETVSSGGTGNPPTVSRDGYDFIGWSDSYTNVTSNRTLIAEYQVQEYTVRFYGFSNELLKTEMVNPHFNATPPTDPSAEGKVFTGWSASYTDITSNLDIYALYDDVYYVVTFIIGTDEFDQNVIHGGTALAPSTNVEGYDFLGWDISYENVVSPLTVTANFAIHQYIVRFFDGDGNLLSSELVDYLSSATTPELVEPTGQEFVSWSDDITTITSDIDIYPIFQTKEYDVSYYDGENLIHTETVLHGSSCTYVPTEKTGYSYIGMDQTCNVVIDDLSIQLLYEPFTYHVLFYNFEDEVISDQFVDYGTSAIPPSSDMFTRFNLTGWSTSFDFVSQDLEVYPTGTVRTYYAVFKDYDGTELCSYQVEYNTSVTCEEPSRVGYLFSGWSDDLIVDESKTIFAEYAAVTYEVDFYLYTQLLKSEIVKYNYNANPPFVSQAGYHFVSWSEPTDHITEDKIIYAIMEKDAYTVTFKDDDFTTLKTEEVQYLESATAPIVEKDGKTFVGWSTEFDQVSADITVVAKYDVKDFVVSFYLEEELITEQTTIFKGSVTAPELDLEGYIFYGWDQELSTITENLSVHAIVEAKQYLVRFYEEDVLLSEELVSYGDAATSPFTAHWSDSFELIESDLDIYLIDRDYPGELASIETDIESKPYLVDGKLFDYPNTIPEKIGYTFLEWEATSEGYEALFEVDEVYMNQTQLIEAYTYHDGHSLTIYFTDDISNFEFLNIVIDGEEYYIDELRYELDRSSIFDQKADYLRFFDLTTFDSITLRDTTLDLIYLINPNESQSHVNLFDESLSPSLWMKFVQWVDQWL